MRSKPGEVEPGQIYRDIDQRSHGAGEFVVTATVRSRSDVPVFREDASDDEKARAERVIERARGSVVALFPLAVVHRPASDRTYRVSIDRLMDPRPDSRGYEYIGRAR